MSKPDGQLPSYAESTEHIPKGQRILDQLTLVRGRHVRSVVDEHVYPILELQAMYGLEKTTIALLPSDMMIVEEKDPFEDDYGITKTPKIELVGFPEEEQLHQVPLQGTLNRLEFWKQTGVLEELRQVLQDRLSTSPQLFQMEPELPLQQQPAPVPTKTPKRGIFGRKSSSQVETAPVAVQAKPALTKRLNAHVGLEEICLRTVSPFGLYETITRNAILIRIHVQC